MTPYEFSKFLIEAEEFKKEGSSKRAIVKILAKKYNCKEETLRSRWKMHVKKEENNKLRPQIAARLKKIRVKGKLILSVTEEAALVTLLKVCAQSNHALKKWDIIEYIRKKYMNGDITWRGDKFFKTFVKRNKNNLTDTSLKVISSTRVAEGQKQSCEEFISVMEGTVAIHNMTAETTINVDEFQLKVSGYSVGRGRITAVRSTGGAHKQVTTDKRGGCVGSLIAFIAANGTLVYSALCLKPDAKSKDPHIAYIDMDAVESKGINTRRRPIPQLRIYTETGMIDNTCWEKIWSGFLAQKNETSPGLHHIVFMDNLAQHCQVKCIEDAVANDTEVRLLPKGTSQFSQACDSYVFGKARKEVNKRTSSKMVTVPHETLNHMVRDIIPEVMEKTFTPAIIKASFKATGTYPFDGEIIRKRCEENLGLRSEDEPDNTLSSVEDIVTEQVTSMFKKDDKSKVKRKRVAVNLRQAYTSGDIIQASKEQERKKAEEEKIKVEKKEASAEKKRLSNMKKEQHRLAVEARKAQREEIKRDAQRKKELATLSKIEGGKGKAVKKSTNSKKELMKSVPAAVTVTTEAEEDS